MQSCLSRYVGLKAGKEMYRLVGGVLHSMFRLFPKRDLYVDADVDESSNVRT